MKKKAQEQWRPYYRIPGLKVSDHGDIIRWYGKELKKTIPTNPPSFLKPQKDKKGNAIVRTKDNGNLRIDRLVETCFHGRPGIHDRIHHKDGNPMNCRLDNIERVNIKEYNRRFHSADEWKELFAEEDEVEINVNTHEVRQHGVLLPIEDEIYDPDTDQQVKIRESVTVTYIDSFGKRVKNRFAIEELLKLLK